MGEGAKPGRQQLLEGVLRELLSPLMRSWGYQRRGRGAETPCMLKSLCKIAGFPRCGNLEKRFHWQAGVRKFPSR